mgnify:CR=1 FL=1
MSSRKRKEKFQPENCNNVTIFQPRNSQQQKLLDSIYSNDITVVSGPAGSGKTLLSIQSLYRLYKQDKIRSIKVIRLIADTFGESLGALPGDSIEKLWDFAGPILDNLQQIIKEGELTDMFANKKIEIIPVSRVRGRSFNNAGVMIEEAQNMSKEMIIACLTRIGENSKFIVNGDPYQSDFYDRNGISYAIDLCQGLAQTGIIRFKDDDIVRHPIIKALLQRKKQLELENYYE